MYKKDMLISSRYSLIHKIGEGGISFVWLAKDLVNNKNVAIKILKKEATSDRIEDILRFRNEAITASKLNTHQIVNIYEVGEVDNIHYIVMEHLEGQSLEEYLMNGKKLTISECIEIACKICTVLKFVHDAGIIYRDLKPGNIIFFPENLEIKLVDFGLSQIREFNSNRIKEIIGTLYYMSPEQSGIIKSKTDERSDLYSFGILLYYITTNKLPFYSESINAIIHQHAAKKPSKPSLINDEIPEILEKIIMKLLEKEPDSRYQSANGLLKDLKYIKDGNYDFNLGRYDKIKKLNFRSSFVGREDEFKNLKQMYDSALNCRGSLFLIGGEAGKGKSRLTEEMRNYVSYKNGIFLDIKCFSGENKTPYSVFKDLLNKYLKVFSKLDDSKKNEIRIRAKESVGDLGGIIIKLNPLAHEILGECTELVKIDAESERIRFNMVVSKFFVSLSEKDNPSLIVFDDLQWIDEGSIEILNELLNYIEKHPIFIIGTYRDNEVKANHPIKKFMINAKKTNKPIREIILKSFDKEKMYKLVSNILHDNGENINQITSFILDKSRGNPFYSVEILKDLVNEGAVVKIEESWKLVSSVLKNIQIASSIVDIILKEISKLNEDEINILSQASVIGKSFSTDFLFNLQGFEPEYVLSIIDKAINMQLLEQDPDDRGTLLFIHDRIKDAFYKKMGQEKRKEAHIKIARLIENISNENIDKVVFNLAHHYSAGEDIKKTIEYAYPAGVRATKNYAYEVALRYFLLSKKYCEIDNEKFSTLWIKTTIEAGKMYSYIGQYNESINFYNEIITLITDKFKKAEYINLFVIHITIKEIGIIRLSLVN